MAKNERMGPQLKVVGVILGWSGKPQLAWKKDAKWWQFWRKGIFILPYNWEYETCKEYYPDGFGTWPKDPITKEELEIYE